MAGPKKKLGLRLDLTNPVVVPGSEDKGARRELNEKEVTMDKRYLLVLAVIAVVLWMFRWDIVAVHRGDSFGYAYKLNRFTGATYLMHGATITEVKPSE